MSYEQLDAIADTYNPLLLLAGLIYIGLSIKNKNRSASIQLFLNITINLLIVYSIKMLDDHFLWWPNIGLDYSTHTGFALALITSFSRHRIIWWLSLLAYCMLMLYQGYHSAVDIVSTALVLLPLFFVIYSLLKRAFNQRITSQH